MQDLGRERSIDKVHPNAAAKMVELVPRPLSPARGDASGRPRAVDYSLRKMRSFEEGRPSVENQARQQHSEAAPTFSPFPKIPAHQRSGGNLRSTAREENMIPRPLAPNHALKEKNSEASLRRAHKVLKKRPGNELNGRPLIHITKPSNERAILIRQGDAPMVPHAM